MLKMFNLNNYLLIKETIYESAHSKYFDCLHFPLLIAQLIQISLDSKEILKFRKQKEDKV